LRIFRIFRKMVALQECTMQVFKSTEVAKRFGAIQQIVQTEPVFVQSHGRPQMVMISPAEYERLRRQDRRVYNSTELPPGLRAAIAAAKPSAEAAQFDKEAAK
jgi:PHD/YefM family antitoxin component YafN of YafNO toxin-antitoxin module